jgi:fucose permease
LNREAEPLHLSAATLGTRLGFFIAGLAIAAWGPLVPYVKARLALNAAELGLVLLCLGVGSVVGMPAAGLIAARRGGRPVVVAGSLGLAVALVAVAASPSVITTALELAMLGLCLGAVDVAINVHGLEVQRRAGRPLMSNFHAFYSLGGLAGAGGMTALLSAGLSPLGAALVVSLAMLLCILTAWPRLLDTRGPGSAPLFVRPRGLVILLGLLTFSAFLVEGAVLDWGAIMLVERHAFARAAAGMGYVLFATAMTGGRLIGDAVIRGFGARRTLQIGGLVTACGIIVAVIAGPVTSLAGFVLIGLGCCNLVPILFSSAGAQKAMPASLAIAAVAMCGYGGSIGGPALVGFLAQRCGLGWAFAGLAGTMALYPLFAASAARPLEASMDDTARASS